jgi:predicted dehydrogenase
MRSVGHSLVAVGARDLARARAYADELGMARAYGSYAALIDDPGIDAVYNALPNDAHSDWTIRALDAGKHVLCEKPLALNAAEVARMTAAAARAGRLLLEAFSPPFHPQFTRARALLQDGALGELIALQSSFCNPLLDADDFRWNPAQGGGALYDLGCYCVNAMRTLTGREPIGATAVQQTSRGVDATLAGQLLFDGGVIGQFTCSFTGARTQHLAIFGTQARLLLDLPFSSRNRVTTLTFGEHSETFEPCDPYARMVAHFAVAAAGGTPPSEDALRQAHAMELLRK